MHIPKWVAIETSKIKKSNEEISKRMERLENWLRKNNLVTNEDDGYIRSIPDKNSIIERTDIESGLWSGEELEDFLKTGKFK